MSQPAESTAFGPTALVVGSNFINPGPLTIDGQTGPNTGITLDGDNVQRIFGVLSNGSLTLDHLTLQHGEALGANGGSSATAGGGGGAAGLGGAIFVNEDGSLTVLNCTFVSNSAQGGNGGAGGNDSAGLGGGGGGGGDGGAGGMGVAQGGGGGGGGVSGPGGNGVIGSGGVGGGGEGYAAAAENSGMSGGGGGGANGNDDGLAGFGEDPSSGGLGGGGGAAITVSSQRNFAGLGGFGAGGGGAGINPGTGDVAAGTAGASMFGGGGGGGAAAPNQGANTGSGSAGFDGGTGGDAAFTSTTATGGSGGGGLGAGGAIFTYAGSVAITNSTFYANFAVGGIGAKNGLALGGAIFDIDGVLNITNATISENRASNGGRGVYAYADGVHPNSVVINDTIIGQTDRSIPDYMQSALPYDVVRSSGTNNLIRSSPAGAADFGGAFSTADPMVLALAANGGPTKTESLEVGSPAIDHATYLVSADQRGVARPQGAANDIGAFEVISTPPPPAQIVFTTHWLTVAPDADFTLTLQAFYADGAVDAGYNRSATLTVVAGQRGGQISGTLTVPFVNGVATFTNLEANELGVYTLAVSEPSLSATTTLNVAAP